MNEVKVQNILAEYADRLADGDVDLDGLLKKHGVDADSEITGFLRLSDALESMLTRVEPSPEFRAALRSELLGSDKDIFSAASRLQKFSTRQVAAAGIAGIGGLTVAAGVIWWTRRRSPLSSGATAEPVMAS